MGWIAPTYAGPKLPEQNRDYRWAVHRYGAFRWRWSVQKAWTQWGDWSTIGGAEGWSLTARLARRRARKRYAALAGCDPGEGVSW